MAKFSVGDIVLNVNTTQKGVVCEIRPAARCGRQLYKVRYDDTLELALEQHLVEVFDIEDPFERCERGIFGNRDQFVLVNTTHKINNSNNNTLSSLKASKTIFKAYQFKPLLKFLNSDSRRILIADEVGLGKTIEAGHILLELKARGEFKSALILCPKSLQKKWETELNEKFGLRFVIYESVEEAINDLRSHPYSARGILNYEKILVKPKNKEQVANFNPTNPLVEFLNSNPIEYSFVLCDEAHRLKNSETKTYKGMVGILDNAEAAVFLTATPIMLGEDDLYNLLHLLEPNRFDNREVFRNLLNSNRPFIQAISMLNTNHPLPQIKALLTDSEIDKTEKRGDFYITSSENIRQTFQGIPMYENILKLLDEPDSLSLRSELQEKISALSPINNIFSRTRKREIATEDRQHTEREAHKCIIRLSVEEQEIFDNVIDDYIDEKGGYEYDGYGEEHIPRGSILGLIQRKRMVTSSVNAYQLFIDSGCDFNEFCSRTELQGKLCDTKIDALIEIFEGVRKSGGSKVIVFSTFKFAVRYLEIKLRQLGFNALAIHGDIKKRDDVIEAFKDSKEFTVLLSTEVGSEGLDLQFCSHLINFDLPWNPMVVEQRIGRIDRFGQKSPLVHIYNLVVANSIQEIIYDRLLERIGVFRGVIGELEMILDSEESRESLRSLESDIYRMRLSKAQQEKRILDRARAFENQKLDLDRVEEGLTNALTNDVYFQNEISKIRSRKLYVTEEELKNYIRMLIAEHLKTCEFQKVDGKQYAFVVPKSTPKVLSNFLYSMKPTGEDFDKLFRTYIFRVKDEIESTGILHLTFDQQYAFENKNADYVNLYSPIIIAASEHFKKDLKSIGSTFQMKYEAPSDFILDKGFYYMAVYSLIINRATLGKNTSSELLVPVLYNLAKDETIEDSEINMTLFGELQEKSVYLSNEEAGASLTKDARDNMESDFTEYISNFIEEKKGEIALREDSQKELRRRKMEQYYDSRINKEERAVEDAEFLMELEEEANEIAKARNIRQLAINRLNMLRRKRDEDMERLDALSSPTLSSKLISLSKILIV